MELSDRISTKVFDWNHFKLLTTSSISHSSLSLRVRSLSIFLFLTLTQNRLLWAEPCSLFLSLHLQRFPSLTSFLSSSHTTSSFLNTTYLPGRGGGGSSKLVDGGDSGALALGGGNAAAQAKKRKLESKGSRGVEALKKVNVKGMKSLKEMFGGAVNSTGKGKAVAAVAKGKKKWYGVWFGGVLGFFCLRVF